MYLLRRESDGEFSLTEYYGQLPPYAILSHTWGPDDEEVTFKDILKSRGKRKSGYEKLRFCAAQAEEDGLEYFWVDTCCIDKTDSVKLSEAINSMFSWYQHSTRCYVYLSDVDALPITLDLFRNRELLEHVLAPAWKSDFKLSKWFTRGWTLQELLAPSSVEFFAKNGERLGDKQTLSQDIHQITAISLEALEESPLRPSGYSVKERLSWAEGRETKREEDAVYSLLGLFGVHMSPIYGEGRPNAYDRLLLEIQRKSALRPSHGTGSSDLQDAAFSSNGQHGNGPLTLKRSASDAFGATLSGPDESDSKHRLVEAKSEKSARDRTEEHLVAMRDWFTEAIAARMDLPSGYQRVAVLLFRWTDELDELRTSNEVSELQRVFRDEFQFETEIVGLNHRSKPQLQMDRSLITFIEEYDGPQNLLIVFYAGSSVRYQSTRRLELLPSLSSLTDRGAFTGGQINWYKTEDMLRSDEVDGDVLAILDTPYASNNEVGHIFNEENNYKGGDERTSRRFQLMAACDETTSGAENQSFTRALIDGMMRLLKDDSCPSFSTQKLHQSIEKVSARSGTTSLIWSLLPNKDHIFLAPLEFSATRRSKARLRGRGYLKLGLEIRDASLEEPQIEYLAGALSALLDKELIGLRRIDWLGFEPRKEALMSFTEHLSLRKSAAHQWKRIVAKKKQEAMDQREYTLRKEWRGTKEALGLESKPPTSPPSDTCAG